MALVEWRPLRRPSLPILLALTLLLGLSGEMLLTGLLLRLREPLSIPQGNDLTLALLSYPEAGISLNYLSLPGYEIWRESLGAPQRGLAAVSSPRPVTIREGQRSRRIRAEYVSSNFFETLALPLVEGSTFRDSERDPDQVIIGSGLARRLYATPPAAIGERLILDRHPFTVVGVVPDSYRGLQWDAVELWLPLEAARILLGPQYPDELSWLAVVAREGQLGRPLDPDRLTAVLRNTPLAQRGGAPVEAILQPLVTFLFDASVQRSLRFLILAGMALLALSILSAGTLLASEARGRERETAVRMAMGAEGSRATRPLRASALLGVGLALAISLLLVRPAAQWLLAMSSIPSASFSDDLDWIWIVTSGVALTILIAAGLTIGVALSSRRLARSPFLTLTGRGTGRRTRASGLLMVAEVAFSTLLLLSTLVLTTSLWRTMELPLGFQPDELLALQVELPQERYDQPAKIVQFADRLQERTRSLAEITAATIEAPRLAPEATQSSDLVAADSDTNIFAFRHAVGDDYFETLRIPLLEGRGLERSDGSDSAPVLVLGRQIAASLWTTPAPMQQVKIEPPLETWSGSWSVAGVVGDVKARGFLGSRFPDHDVYVPFRQAPERSLFLLVRSRSSIAATERTLHGIVQSLDPDLALATLTTLEDRYAVQLGDLRFTLVVLAAFAVCAAVLTATGIFGTTRASLLRRLPEIAVRLALGGQPLRLYLTLMGSVLSRTGVGVAVGLLMYVPFHRFLSGVVEGYGGFSLAPAVVAIAVILALATLAAVGPAWRASRVDPAQRLREADG